MGYRSEFECPYCDPDDYDLERVFNTVEELARHRNKEHPGHVIHVCAACDKTFGKNQWDKATDHAVFAHDLFCEDCQMTSFYEALDLSSEEKTRIGEIHNKIAELREELEQICTMKGNFTFEVRK